MLGCSEIFKYEIKKIFKAPIVMVLFIVFLAFDLFTVFNGYKIRNNLGVLNNIVDEVGYKIDDEMMAKFKVYYKQNLDEAMTIINENEGKNYNSISDYLNEDKAAFYKGKYNKDEEKIIKSTAEIEDYYMSIPNLIKSYDNIDVTKISGKSIEFLNLSGEAEEMSKQGFEKFNNRFTQIKENEEQMWLFFNGKNYDMHGFLYKDILRNVIIQMMILIPLIATFFMNYEFENETSLVAYSSKRGRNLICDKLKAITVAVLILGTVLLTIVLITFFFVYDYSRVWNTSISSFFNWGGKSLYMSWFNLTVKQYLMLMILLTYSCFLLFTSIAFVIGRFIKNSFIGFVSFFIISGIGFMLPSFISGSSRVRIYSAFTPFALIFNLELRFMESGGLTIFKHYELITIITWSIIMIIVMWYSIKSFKKQCIS